MGEASFFDLLQGRAPKEAIDRLVAYGELLERWADHHNLVRAADRQELVDRHILESLAPINHISTAGRLVDIGSGAGLPGVPLLCAMEQWSGLLVEPRRKRWAFLSFIVRELGLRARAVRARYEVLEETGFDLVTARAVGGHEALLAWSARHVAPTGAVAIWGTIKEAERLGEPPGWSMLSSPLPGLDSGRLIFFKVCFT